MRRQPGTVDRHIGMRLGERRRAVGLTQSDLARHLGITPQQVQKYESGANRIGAGQLYALSRLLKVPVTYFYMGLAGNGAAKAAAPSEGDARMALEFAATPEGRDICLAILSIEEAEARRFLLTIVRLFAMERGGRL